MNVKYAGLLLYLALAAIRDLRQRTVSIRLALIFGGIAVFLHLVYESAGGVSLGRGWIDIMTDYIIWIVFSCLPGLFLLFLAWVTREAIGMGDGIALVTAGLYLGWRGCVSILMISLLLTCPVALGMLLWKKADRKTALPFLPFLLTGYVIWLIV